MSTTKWRIEVEFEGGEVFSRETFVDPRNAGWECVFPSALAIRYVPLSPAPVQTPPSGSVAAPIEAAQEQGTPSLDKPVCRRGACAPDRLCASCEFPMSLGAVGVGSLPAEVPESETLWVYLSRGYGLDYVRSGLVCGIPHVEQEARHLRDRVQRAWARIVSEVQ